MGKKINGEKLKAFIFRRRINALTLLSITLLSISATVFCALTGFAPVRLNILVIVSVLLVLLCAVQFYRMRSSFRTMKNFKGKRKKKSPEAE